MMVGGWPSFIFGWKKAMGILEVIGLISLVLMALAVGFHLGQKK